MASEEEDIRQPNRKKSSGTKSSEHTNDIYSSNAAKEAELSVTVDRQIKRLNEHIEHLKCGLSERPLGLPKAGRSNEPNFLESLVSYTPKSSVVLDHLDHQGLKNYRFALEMLRVSRVAQA